MSTGAAFEIAQNQVDGWYLEPGQGSTGEKDVCAFGFAFLVLMVQAVVAMACMGASWWVSATMLVLAGLFPVLYLFDKAHALAFAVGGLTATLLVYICFETPLIFLSFLLTWLTGYFFGLLKTTSAQSLHGFATLVASSQGLLLALCIQDAADGQVYMGWIPVAAIATVLIGLALGLKRRLGSLTPTHRPR